MNVGADQVMVVLGCVLALQERIMEQLTRDRAQQQRQLETMNARFEDLVLRLLMCRVPGFPRVQPEIRSPQSEAGACDGAVGSAAHAVSPEAPEPGVSATSSGSGDPYGSHIPWPARQLHRGVLVATCLARRVAMEEALHGLERIGWNWPGHSKLLRAVMLLEPPLDSQRLQNGRLSAAEAYDLVFEVRKSCDTTVAGFDNLAKSASLAVREVLVLQICCSSFSMPDSVFETCLERSFGRQLEPELRSQLLLARASICRLGGNRSQFDQAAPKIFTKLNPEELDELVGAYQDCKQQQAITTLFGTQHGKGKRKRRHRAATAEIAQETDAAVTDLEPEEDHAVDVAESGEEQELFRANQSESATVLMETMMPWRVEPIMERPEWTQMQRSWNRCARETCPDLADMMQRLEAKLDTLIALSQQYANKIKMPSNLATDVVQMPACEAVVWCASTQTQHIMQSETQGPALRPPSSTAL